MCSALFESGTRSVWTMRIILFRERHNTVGCLVSRRFDRIGHHTCTGLKECVVLQYSSELVDML